jgi:hypothetical protein
MPAMGPSTCLARVIRSVGGQDIRGLVSWEHYLHASDFRDSETGELHSLGYPLTRVSCHYCFLPFKSEMSDYFRC